LGRHRAVAFDTVINKQNHCVLRRRIKKINWLDTTHLRGLSASALAFESSGKEMLGMTEDKNSEFKKPLDKMTVKELKEVALEIPEITGVHGMNKSDLLSAIKAAKGIEDEVKKKGSGTVQKGSGTVREIKQKIKALKIKRNEATEEKNSKMATIYRRRISRLKKKARKVA
jgi:hypothetical protein